MSKKLLTISLLCIFFLAKNSFGAGISLIRDAQTEKFLHELSDPIFRAANLDPNNIKLYIVNDNSLNAFVSGGQNVFFNTGLIRKFPTPNALIGVMAHETGHIAAGHLARSTEGQEQAQGALLLSYLLGVGAVAAGAPEAGMAIISGGSNTAQRLYLKFTRHQEEAADNHAISYLRKMSYPASGLVQLLELFDQQLIGYRGNIDEYLLSHPVSRKRINLIKSRTKDDGFSGRKFNTKLQRSMDIILAKLEAFIDDPDRVISKNKNKNDELAIYRQSIAFFRKGETDKSLNLLQKIINLNSKNKSELGFLYELKGQILFENGRIQDSIIAYNTSIKLIEKQYSAQAKINFAVALISLKESDEDLIKLAIKHLEESKRFEKENPFLFQQLAKSYAKINDDGRSLLALAEFKFLTGKKKECIKYAKSAQEKLSKRDKVEILRADDLIELAKEDVKKSKKKDP